jgi:hypothetical protein
VHVHLRGHPGGEHPQVGIRFQLLNLFGALGLLANGIWHDAWPSAALNAVWLVIGVTALRSLRSTPQLDGPERGAAAHPRDLTG